MIHTEPRVLVVDDEEQLRSLIAYALSSAGMTVEAAETGADALDIVRQLPVDLIVLDVLLPDANGVINQLRHNEGVPVEDVAASFQRAVVDVLLHKTEKAATALGAKAVCLAGGVAANSELRRRAVSVFDAIGVRAFLPSRSMCTDNAAMIAAAGAMRLRTDGASPLELGAEPNLSLPWMT